ncbi:MAG: hypothetical protein UU08_C0012G0007 [Candidatus Uhrbacteria bacterium GW2011_GWE2_40_58]|nr:MAG: hypothetical protein UT94_C0011G0012 [Candidatus Uhrbacteria bacterium GW2011_GWF2_40_263]KKR67643.1 MAG: hypothetical protein UU08_C0012G0007 [Candidatus Uhrbacteria bacterium GW2011_GWE2_40_58]OGL94430.1 MAG: hypothetical protein A2239_01955 [Candidatus Uhrbacteria bacterium RIFOXYA2_FULL_40_9]OGL96676.1 MAG: hypothetical protein A2332_05125 [Candidatus Uhrbacteria bacterium RIFOXYB2_FULL_41_18]HBK34710.1 hypothetical protein [Candidatus Uhrbacteria bacterium]
MKKTIQQASIEKWFFLLVAAVVLYLFWSIIQPFAILIITAGIAAVALVPLDQFFFKIVKQRKLSAIMTSLGMFLVIIIPLILILLLIAKQATELIQLSLGEQGWLTTFNLTDHKIYQLLPVYVQEQILSIDLQTVGLNVAQWIIDNIGGLFSSTSRFLLNIFLFFIALYYLLVDRKKLHIEILALSPFDNEVDAKIIHRIASTIRHVVFGILVLAIIQGLFAGIGMTIFGVPGSVIWGAFTIIAALVPLVGSALVLVPAVIYLFMIGNVGSAIGLALWAALVVGLSDNIVAPYLIKGTTHMHMFLVLISILGGIQIFGSIGFIIGPTILAAFLVVIDLYKSGILKDGQWS